MKKLLLTLMACFAVITANADYWLIGGFNNWTQQQANCKFTAQNDGTYTLDYVGTLTSGFKINNGSWNDDNNNWGGGGKLTLGVTYTLTAAGTSADITMDQSVVNPHLVFNPTAKTLLITGQEQAVETIYGIHSNWFDTTNWSTSNMTQQSNGTWTLASQTIPAGTFGIKAMDKATGSQTAWIAASGTSTITPNTAIPCKENGSNFTNPAGEFEIIFDPTAMTITFNGTQTGEDAKPDYSSWYVNIVGEFNSWQDNGQQPNAQNIATLENLSIGTYGFKVKVYNGSDNWYVGSTESIETNKWVQLVAQEGDPAATKIDGATAGSTYQAQYNVETNEIYLTPSGEVQVTYPDQLYLIGQVGEYDWNPTQGYETSGNEGIYTFNDMQLNAGQDGNAYFGFTTTLGNANDDEGWATLNANRYGAPESDTEVKAGDSNITMSFKNENSWKIAPGKYTFVVNLTNNTFSITGTATEPEPETPTAPEALYLIGDINDWALADEDYKLTQTEQEGIWTWTGTTLKGGFKFNDGKWDNGWNIGANDTEITIGEALEVYNNSETKNILLPEDATVENPTIVLNISNPEELTVTLTGTLVLPETPYVPEVIYFKGSFDNWASGAALAKNDNGLYVGTVEFPEGETNEFKLDCGNNKWFGADGDANVSFGEGMEVVLGMNATGSNWTLVDWDGGNFTATVDWDEKTLTLSGYTSAIASLQNEKENNVIYNLQGVRVDSNKLAKGIYIINGKKVMVK